MAYSVVVVVEAAATVVVAAVVASALVVVGKGFVVSSTSLLEKTIDSYQHSDSLEHSVSPLDSGVVTMTN